jgi:hypothetical protein
MGHALHHLDALADIPALPEDARRGAWRQALAELASQAADRIPVPLEGMNAPHIEESVRWALSQGLVDDLGWLSPEHGAAALYELAGALRPGEERRELGRRVLEELMQGNAATFVALAQRLSVGSRRGLTGPGIRPRVGLVLDLPVGFATGAEGLALSLLTRPDLERAWAVDPSTGSLPSRRLAARLLESAAIEALRRSTDRFGSVVSLFERPDIQATWNRLLSDREPLVWRHVASARGLLSRQIPMLEGDIVRDLADDLTPTEWRRAAASSAAAVAVDPESALERCRSILSGRVFQQDPGVAGAMVLGLSRAVDVEPDAADILLGQLVQTGGLDAIEALVQLRQEHAQANVGARAVPAARERLANGSFDPGGDDGRAALIRWLDRELESAETFTLRARSRIAVSAFVSDGAAAAHVKALECLAEVDVLLDKLESTTLASADGRHDSFLILRELDHGLLERSTLPDLLALGAHPQAALARLDAQLDRLADWLLQAEQCRSPHHGKVSHFTLHLHTLRAMLHLVDANPIVTGTSSAGRRGRKLRTARLLLDRVSRDAPSPLRRVLAASAARACDALLREEIGELSDILIIVGDRVRDEVDLTTMAEAAMEPAVVTGLQGYCRFLRGSKQAPSGSSLGPLEALDEVVRGLPVLGSPRVDALRGATLAYSSSVSALLSARCLAQVAGEGGTAPCVPPLADASAWLARLAVGARRRLDEQDVKAAVCGTALQRVDAGVEHALRGDRSPLREAVIDALAALRSELPLGLANAVDQALGRLLDLPADMQEEAPFELARPRAPISLVLPAWMPPNRVIGGFYVRRLLGFGGVGSVFVVCRVEDRSRRHASHFAMKVPEYGPDVAHTLSEAEFLDMFRGEAGALLSIPAHPNLARFVTFDAGARPKPILVMELVEGPTLQRLIQTRVLGMSQALTILDGVAAGLEAMHAIGLGHLDVKPGNVILRASEARVSSPDIDVPVRGPSLPPSDNEATPVLVDFGLAGQKIRPGCATAAYGAPEIWGYVTEGLDPLPMPADVYAFACMAYETLTGEELFRDANHLAVIASHVGHDGNPAGLAKLWSNLALAGLGNVLSWGLRRDPRMRCTISELRRGLAQLGLERWSWPLR